MKSLIPSKGGLSSLQTGCAQSKAGADPAVPRADPPVSHSTRASLPLYLCARWASEALQNPHYSTTSQMTPFNTSIQLGSAFRHSWSSCLQEQWLCCLWAGSTALLRAPEPPSPCKADKGTGDLLKNKWLRQSWLMYIKGCTSQSKRSEMSLGGLRLKSLQRELLLLVLIKSQGWSTVTLLLSGPVAWSVGHKFFPGQQYLGSKPPNHGSAWFPMWAALQGKQSIMRCRARQRVQKQRAMAPGAVPQIPLSKVSCCQPCCVALVALSPRVTGSSTASHDESLPWAHKHLHTLLEFLGNEISLDSHENFFSFLWLLQTADKYSSPHQASLMQQPNWAEHTSLQFSYSTLNPQRHTHFALLWRGKSNAC